VFYKVIAQGMSMMMSKISLTADGKGRESSDPTFSLDLEKYLAPAVGTIVRSDDANGEHIEERVLELESGGAVINGISVNITTVERLFDSWARGDRLEYFRPPHPATAEMVSAFVDPDSHMVVLGPRLTIVLLGAEKTPFARMPEVGEDWVAEVVFRVPHHTFVRNFSVGVVNSATVTFENFSTTDHETKDVYHITTPGGTASFPATLEMIGFEELVEEDGTLHLGVLIRVRVAVAEFNGVQFMYEYVPGQRTYATKDERCIWTTNSEPIYDGAWSLDVNFNVEFESYVLPGSFDIPKVRQSLLLLDTRAKVIEMRGQLRAVIRSLTSGTSHGFEIGGLLQSLGMVFAVIPFTSGFGAALLGLGGLVTVGATSKAMIEEGRGGIAIAVESAALLIASAAGVRKQLKRAGRQRRELFGQSVGETLSEEIKNNLTLAGSFDHFSTAEVTAAMHNLEPARSPKIRQSELVPSVRYLPVDSTTGVEPIDSAFRGLGFNREGNMMTRSYSVVTDPNDETNIYIMRSRMMRIRGNTTSFHEVFINGDFVPTTSALDFVPEKVRTDPFQSPGLSFDLTWGFELNRTGGEENGWRLAVQPATNVSALAYSAGSADSLDLVNFARYGTLPTMTEPELIEFNNTLSRIVADLLPL
jgi:hypothetical protein